MNEWQLDVTEAIMLGLDSVVIAGTGAGKMVPLLLSKHKKAIITSPLKVLQADQVRTVLAVYGAGTSSKHHHFCVAKIGKPFFLSLW